MLLLMNDKVLTGFLHGANCLGLEIAYFYWSSSPISLDAYLCLDLSLPAITQLCFPQSVDPPLHSVNDIRRNLDGWGKTTRLLKTQSSIHKELTW